jgi:GntR family transcriptional regulator
MILIDLDAPTPIFAQVINQIKDAVVNNKIVPGDPLPSIRQLANDLEINSKTVAKAYALLERDSIIETKGYRGTFIHPNAKNNSAVDLSSWVENKLAELVIELKQAGVTDSELRIAFNQVMTKRNN